MPEETRIRSELDVLTSIERGEVVTQAALTRRIGVSIGLVNALLKRAIHKGYVKTRQVPYKRYAYYLTPRGFAEKSRLVAEYLDHSLHLYRRARSEYGELLASARAAGLSRLILSGPGDLAEIAILSAWGEGVTLVGIVEPGANESHRLGLPIVRSLDDAGAFDAVIVTDARDPQKTYDSLRERLPEARVLAPAFLKITCDRDELLSEQSRLERRA